MIKTSCIIDFIKRDNHQTFVELLIEKDKNLFYQNFISLNELIQEKYRTQILHLCAQYNAYEICKIICSYPVSVSYFFF